MGAVQPVPPIAHRNPPRPRIVRWGKKLRWRVNDIVSRCSRVPLDPIIDTRHFPWLRKLETAAPLIEAEAAHLLKHLRGVPPMNEMSPDHRRIAGDGGWRSFFLIGYGYRIEANCARCPNTMKALDQVPGLVTALFSILEPGMHVGRHSGVSKGILIAHLGLCVPRDARSCRMDVDGRTISWSEGETFVFDDTFPHEVWNDTDEHRVILLIQFKRPMGLMGRLVSGAFIWAVKHSPYIQDARGNIDYWEKRLADEESGRPR